MLYFNLFPRTGSSFLATLCSNVLRTEIAVIREPDRYKDHINQVVLFRNPYDTISSLIERTRNQGFLENENISWTNGIEQEIEYRNDDYIRFIDLAIENFSNLHTGVFEDVMQNPVDFLKTAGSRFDIKIIENQNPIDIALDSLQGMHVEGKSINFGHYIREKNENRLLIEQAVKNAECLKKSFEKYQIFAGMVKNDSN